jgi:putative photosynthetic complex assembly protein
MNVLIHEAQQRVVIPLPVLIGAGLAVAVSIVVAAIGGSHTKPPPSRLLESRTLSFTDAADGAVLVTDATTGAPVARLAPGTNGFVRGTLRALAHEDGHAAHAAAMHPFVLSSFADGRLTLDDPTDGQRLDLEAFGSLNTAAFAALLAPGRGESTGEGRREGAGK